MERGASGRSTRNAISCRDKVRRVDLINSCSLMVRICDLELLVYNRRNALISGDAITVCKVVRLCLRFANQW